MFNVKGGLLTKKKKNSVNIPLEGLPNLTRLKIIIQKNLFFLGV